MFEKKSRNLKNPNGYGCVVYLGKDRRRPYAIKISYRDRDGLLKRKYLDYFENEKDALRALKDYNVSPISDKENITLEELYSEWSYKHFNNISQSMIWNYKASWKHFEPLQNQKFKDLRTAHYQKIVDNAYKTTKEKVTTKNGTVKTVKKNVPLSVSSKDKIKVLLTQLYSYAIQNDIVNKNYAEFIELPKKEKTKKEIFNDMEIKTLEDNASMENVDTILILIYTGFRINEMLSLTKSNVDFKEGTITGGLKTDAGKNRVVPIHPKILRYLKARYDKATDKLFTKGENEVITSNYYRKYIYYPILEKLNIARKKPHTTRHTCATLLARAGADTNSIKLILGHTDYAFTADTYTHIDINDLKKAINLI